MKNNSNCSILEKSGMTKSERDEIVNKLYNIGYSTEYHYAYEKNNDDILTGNQYLMITAYQNTYLMHPSFEVTKFPKSLINCLGENILIRTSVEQFLMDAEQFYKLSNDECEKHKQRLKKK
jgi:hypothetical protein